jgi:aspartate/methionine/tyrosine aminotransferase
VFSSRTPANLTPNRLTDSVRAARGGGQPFIDLTISNPTRAGFAYPPDLLAGLADARALCYEPQAAGALDARAAVAADCARQGMAVAPGRIVLTASTSDAYGLLFKLLADAGDEVLVPRPSYPLFDHLTRLELVTTRGYDLDIHGNWSIDFVSVERALTARTRAVLVVSPNNPTGSFVTREEMDRLAAICGPRGIAIVADEVFADYELEPGAAARAGRAASRGDVLTFALGGLSKSAGLPQVKLGWILVGGPERLAAEALERLELIADTYLSVSTPVQIAAAGLLARGAAVRSQIAARVAANYRWLHAAVTRESSCRVRRSDGGWYAVLQVPSIESEEDLAIRLLTTRGVLAHPGYFYDFPRESFLVVSLLPAPETFADGVTRVLRHFDCTESAPS